MFMCGILSPQGRSIHGFLGFGLKCQTPEPRPRLTCTDPNYARLYSVEHFRKFYHCPFHLRL